MSYTAEQSAQALLALIVAQGGRPGRSYGFVPTGPALNIDNFPGALQADFLNEGYAITDLSAALDYAVAQNWLIAGQAYGGLQSYQLAPTGWSQGGGTAPAIADSAQRLTNVAAALNNTPGAVVFNLNFLADSFVGTAGDDTFEIEDMLPGFGQAIASNWIQPSGPRPFDPIFTLTAAGVAQAS